MFSVFYKTHDSIQSARNNYDGIIGGQFFFFRTDCVKVLLMADKETCVFVLFFLTASIVFN